MRRTAKENEIFKKNPTQIIKHFSEKWRFASDVICYDKFCESVKKNYLYNKIPFKSIPKLYQAILQNADITPRITISREDYNYFDKKESLIQSVAIRQNIRKIRYLAERNNLTFCAQRGNGGALTRLEDFSGDAPEPYLIKLVSADAYKKLSRLKRSDFELINHKKINGEVKLLSGNAFSINPRELEEKSTDIIIQTVYDETEEKVKLKVYNKTLSNEEYAKKLNDLKKKYVSSPRKKHLICYHSKHPLDQLLNPTTTKKYEHEFKDKAVLVFTDPYLLDLKTMTPSDEKEPETDDLVNLFRIYERRVNKRSFLFHSGYYAKSRYNPEENDYNQILYDKRQLELRKFDEYLQNLKNANSDDYEILRDFEATRVVSVSEDLGKLMTKWETAFNEFYLTFLFEENRLERLIDEKLVKELKRIYPKKEGLYQPHKRVGEYFCDIYNNCFNPFVKL